MSASANVVSARGLRKGYKNKLALNGTDFDIPVGRIVGLIGPNGAGKTTALKAILGLIPFEGELKVLVDSGVRSGLDVARMLALGADAVMIGRAFIYALAAGGQAGVENLLDLFEKELRVAMTLCGAKSVSELTRDSLALDSLSLGDQAPDTRRAS